MGGSAWLRIPRDRWLAAVLAGLALVSVTIAAVLLFPILLPYVGYIFEVMRAETLVVSIRKRARRELAHAVARNGPDECREEVLSALAQLTDISLGSIQLGDMPVCILSIDVAGRF